MKKNSAADPLNTYGTKLRIIFPSGVQNFVVYGGCLCKWE